MEPVHRCNNDLRATILLVAKILKLDTPVTTCCHEKFGRHASWSTHIGIGHATAATPLNSRTSEDITFQGLIPGQLLVMDGKRPAGLLFCSLL